jgi:hypothetical protein
VGVLLDVLPGDKNSCHAGQRPAQEDAGKLPFKKTGLQLIVLKLIGKYLEVDLRVGSVCLLQITFKGKGLPAIPKVREGEQSMQVRFYFKAPWC